MTQWLGTYDTRTDTIAAWDAPLDAYLDHAVSAPAGTPPAA